MELRVNFNDESRDESEETLKALAAKFCNVLLTNALLLADRDPPYISLVMHDPIGEEGNQYIDISKYQVEGQCPACGHDLE
jgi:hypothetical protein